MTPAKDTDARSGESIARAVIERLDKAGSERAMLLAAEGSTLLEDRPRNWAKLLDWNRRACGYLFAMAR